MLSGNIDCLSRTDGLCERKPNLSIQLYYHHDRMVSLSSRLSSTEKLTPSSTDNYNNASYSICNTAFIFESFGDPNPKTDIVCGDKSQVWSYYRQVPASISENRKC